MKMKLLILLAVGAVCVHAKSVRERIADGLKGTRHQCEYNGQTFQEGESLPTNHLCLSCNCTSSFLEPNSHHCQVIECPTTNHIELGCIPVYKDSECCPVDWNCDSRQTIKEKCDRRFYTHYAEKGCTPMYEEGSVCPSRFKCPTKMEYDKTKCYYQGKLYESGDRIPVSNPCRICTCRRDWGLEGSVEIDCISVECFHRAPMEDGCYRAYENDTCCGNRFQCTPTETTCEHDGKTYQLGQRIYPEGEPCLVCTCTEDWNGIYGSSCRVINCNIDMDRAMLSRGCIPIYHEATCCPIEFHCPEDNLDPENGTLLLRQETGVASEHSCLYKGVPYPLGHQLDIHHPTNCVGCTCTTPPDFTCIHRTTCPRSPVEEKIKEEGPQCSEVRCARGCSVVTVHNSCPFCQCSEKLCSIPKCRKGCFLDRNVPEGECFRCQCSRKVAELACSPVKCLDHCHEVTVPGGCPVCVCGPLCSPPKCDPECHVKRDVAEGECPACSCPGTSELSDVVQCSPVQCNPGCREEVSVESGCPTCVCSTFCSPPKCDPECHLQPSTVPGQCAQCVCSESQVSVAAAPVRLCAPVKCGPVCHEAFEGDGCPTCICDPQCAMIKCELGCHLHYSSFSGPCPDCRCSSDLDISEPRIQCTPPICDAGCEVDYYSEPCPICSCAESAGPEALHCSPPKCEENCRVDYSTKPCPSCNCEAVRKISDIMCSSPKCEEGCNVDYSSKPCPICKCDPRLRISDIMCSPPKCEEGCRIDYNTKFCPFCDCSSSSGIQSILCSPPKCDPDCQIDYDSRPCPSCTCGGTRTGVSDILCSSPKCEEGCRVDYSTKPCPSCKCGSSSGIPDILCSPPICDDGCQVDYSTKPCPSCKCGSNSGIPDILCSPPKCDEGCRLDYSTKPCPSCNCGSNSGIPDILCSPPKCDEGCRVDYSTKPCPSCKCGSNSGTDILCSPLNCEEGCRVDYSTTPCPSCKCGLNSGIPDILCSPPKCEEGCRVDYGTKPCPSCKCGRNADPPPTLQCSPPKCDDPGCRMDYTTKPCPSCKCENVASPAVLCIPPKCDPGCNMDYNSEPCPFCSCNEQSAPCSPVKCAADCQEVTGSNGCPFCSCEGPVCSIPKCEGGCWVDFHSGKCPTCVCDAPDQQLQSSAQEVQPLNIFFDPYCSGLKCGPDCEMGQGPPGANERCPSCICSGSAGQRKKCAPMECELPCRFQRFSKHACPICLCYPMPGTSGVY